MSVPIAKSRWFEKMFGDELDRAAASLPPEVAGSAAARGRAGDIWETAEKCLSGLRGGRAGDVPALF